MIEIKELEKKILNETDKILFYESVKCLESKTYRAGYILAWISIVESLKRKIADLANTGDKQTQESLKKIENLEKNEKSADIQIITEALNVSLIEKDDHKKLQFFWGQRCLFAHPYEKAPTEDELIFIIRQSIDLTLGRKLEFKKNYIDELVNNLTNKSHFLPNDNSAIESYAKKIIPRISKNLHSYFFKVLIAKIGELKDEETKKVFLKRLRFFTVHLLKSTNQKLADNKWRMEDLALNHTFEFVLGTCDSRVWRKLPTRVRSLVLEYIIQDDKTREIYIALRILSKIYKKNLFTKKNEEKFEKLIAEINVLESSEFYKNESKLANRLIQELDSGDYYRQQDAIRVLKSDLGQEVQENLHLVKCIDIGRRITTAAEYGCFEAKDVMSNINFRFNDNLKKGFFVGLFVDRDMEFKFSESIFSNLINHIDNSDNEFKESIKEYIHLNKNIDDSLPFRMNDYHLRNFETTIERVENINSFKKETIDFLKYILEEYK
ncbi:hypothetical protein [Aequorivita sinensis]|uniref:hypothetical protein n=1 Tax=Aequorivita sinensis TaxID=1382458 RepID=UPI0023004789|nr:hypothetical protein [Aequorivita sinensis]